MKRNFRAGRIFAPKPRKAGGSSAFAWGQGRPTALHALLLLGLSALLLFPAGCSIGTGDVDLSILPEEVTYTGLTEWIRTGFQVYARRMENDHPADGFEVTITASFAGEDCAGPLYNQYFVLEDADGNPVNCPWRTKTRGDGQVRFNLRFLGSDECFLWRSMVNVFGEEGTYASSSVKNCCRVVLPDGTTLIECPE